MVIALKCNSTQATEHRGSSKRMDYFCSAAKISGVRQIGQS